MVEDSEIKSISSSLSKIKLKRDKLIDSKNKALRLATKKINARYNDLIEKEEKEFEISNQLLDKVTNTHNEYFTFNKALLIKYICKYISFIEGEEFVYIDGIIYSSLSDIVLSKKSFNVDNIKSVDEYFKSTLNGDIIVIKPLYFYSSMEILPTYKYLKKDNMYEIKKCIDCKKYDYVYDLIDAFINYKIKNRINILNENAMDILYNIYIQSRDKKERCETHEIHK